MTSPTTRSRRRRWPLVLGALAALFAVWLGLCLRYVAFPTVDPYRDIDGIYVLGPAETRIDLGRRLAEEYDAKALLVTVSVDPRTGAVYEKGFCDEQPDYEVICLIPSPYTTQGEAQELARYAQANNWGTVAVLTGTPHISRARLWMNRYVQADVVMWEAPLNRSPFDWAYSFVYQSGAWIKAMIQGA